MSQQKFKARFLIWLQNNIMIGELFSLFLNHSSVYFYETKEMVNQESLLRKFESVTKYARTFSKVKPETQVPVKKIPKPTRVSNRQLNPKKHPIKLNKTIQRNQLCKNLQDKKTNNKITNFKNEFTKPKPEIKNKNELKAIEGKKSDSKVEYLNQFFSSKSYLTTFSASTSSKVTTSTIHTNSDLKQQKFRFCDSILEESTQKHIKNKQYQMSPLKSSTKIKDQSDSEENEVNDLLSFDQTNTNVTNQFFLIENNTNKLNGKWVPDWARDLESIKTVSLQQKNENLNLEVFGKIDRKSHIPLDEMMGYDNDFGDRSESADWSDLE